MSGTSRFERQWLWYASRTPDCLSLDRAAYPTSTYDGRPIPWPTWACRAPDGGIHASANLPSIDVQLAKMPSGQDQFTWTCEFQVRLLRMDWFAPIADLVDPERVAIGRVFVGRERLENWVTVHGRRPPLLLSRGGWTKRCPICGDPFSLRRGPVFFSDPAVLDQRLVVNDKGLFIREDEATRRGLRSPVGAFKPTRVQLRLAGPDRIAGAPI